MLIIGWKYINKVISIKSKNTYSSVTGNATCVTDHFPTFPYKYDTLIPVTVNIPILDINFYAVERKFRKHDASKL